MTREWALERLSKESKVLPNGCIVWTGSVKDKNPFHYGNYGRFGVTIDKYTVKQYHVHRVSMWVYNENFDLEAKELVLHKCGNPLCINPLHLYIGDHSDNTLDQVKDKTHNNSRKDTCIRGHKLSGSNLYITRDGRRNCKKCKDLSKIRMLERNGHKVTRI